MMNKPIDLKSLQEYIKELATAKVFIRDNNDNKLDHTVLASIYKHLVSKMPNWKKLKQEISQSKYIDNKNAQNDINDGNITTHAHLSKFLDKDGKHPTHNDRLMVGNYQGYPALYVLRYTIAEGSKNDLSSDWSAKDIKKVINASSLGFKHVKYDLSFGLAMICLGLFVFNIMVLFCAVASLNLTITISSVVSGIFLFCGAYPFIKMSNFTKSMFSKKLVSISTFLNIIGSCLNQSNCLRDSIEESNHKVNDLNHYKQHAQKHLKELSSGKHSWSKSEQKVKEGLYD